MPVYNGFRFVGKAIESILNQSYGHFEFIIIDDGSTDNTWKILRSYARKDKRIRLLRNEQNKGVSMAMKSALHAARGNYIARMDADDISYLHRLDKQITYLLAHPKTVAVGGQCVIINKNGKRIGTKTFPTDFKDIYDYIFLFIPVQQPTLMIARNRLPTDFSFYVDGMNTAEEVELIFKLFQYGKVENLPQKLLQYRIHDANTSLLDVRKTYFLTLLSRFKAVIAYGYRPTLMGIIGTIIETAVLLLLPKSIVIKLYGFLKLFHSTAKSTKAYQHMFQRYSLLKQLITIKRYALNLR